MLKMKASIYSALNLAPKSGDGGSVQEVKAILLFDGLCGVCSRSVRFILAHERGPSTLFVAIQSESGRALAHRYGIDADNPSTFLLIENGRTHQKSAGIIALAGHLRLPWYAAGYLRFVPEGWRNRLYDVLARNRFRVFGRSVACEVPPPHVRHRFVLPEYQ